MDTHEVFELLWAFLCTIGYAGANTNIWHEHHAHSEWKLIKFLNCCGCTCVVLDMVVLRPKFRTSTMHIPSAHDEVSEVLWAYLCIVGYGGSKTNIWN